MPNFHQNVKNSLIQHQGKVLITLMTADESRLELTGADLLGQISQLRDCFNISGVTVSTHVLLLLKPEDGLISAILACMANGCNPVVPPKGMSKLGLLSFLKNEKIKYCLLHQNTNVLVKITLGLFAKVLTVPEFFVPSKCTIESYVSDPTVPALTSYSSGSTGKPKKLERSHAVLSAQHHALKAVFPPWEGQKDFPLFPNVVLHNLAVGVPTVFPAIAQFDLRLLDVEVIAEQILNENIDSMSGNSFYYSALVNHAKTKHLVFSNIQGLVIGGSPISDVLLLEMSKVFVHAKIYVVYGATEAEPIAISEFKPKDLTSELKGYSVGKIYEGITLDIKDPVKLRVSNKSVEAGEILVKGDHVITGSSGWLETGDFGYLNDEKELVLTARSGNEGVYHGVQHYMIEHACKDLNGLNNLAAIYTPKGFKIYFDGDLTIQSLKKHLSTTTFDGLIATVEQKAKIPMDDRHLSKILYRQLTSDANGI